MYPTIDIQFQNGNNGAVVVSPDGVFGLIVQHPGIGNVGAVRPVWHLNMYNLTIGPIIFNLPGVAPVTIDATGETFMTMADFKLFVLDNWPVTPGWEVEDGGGSILDIVGPDVNSGDYVIGDVTAANVYYTMTFDAGSSEITGTFEPDSVYMVKSMADVMALGVIDDIVNHKLFNWCRHFYNEAGTGTELWIMPVDKDVPMAANFQLTGAVGPINRAKKLCDMAQSKLRAIFTLFDPGDYTSSIVDELDGEVWETRAVAQIFLNDYTTTKRAPMFVILEGYNFTGNKVGLRDLNQDSFNRIGILIGNTEPYTHPSSPRGAATGLLAGRLAKYQVHVNAGKVLNGPLTAENIYIGNIPADLFDGEALHDKGYITFRNHVGRSGFFFSDDPLSTLAADDYKHITHRRVIDKAYRIIYNALLDSLLDDVAVTNTGTILPSYAKTLEGKVTKAISEQMTARGELSSDPTNPNDKGVICKISLTNNYSQTSQIVFDTLQVRPKGHTRYFDVPLGFVSSNSNA